MNALERFDNAVKAYLSDLLSTGSSENTVKNYSKRLGYFRKYLDENKITVDPTSNEVRGWRDSLIDRGVSLKTVKQYLIELKAFYEYATDEGINLYEKNPVSKRIIPKHSRSDDKPYDKILDDIDMMLLWKNHAPKGSRYWARNYAIVTLLLDGKIRNAELLDMKLSDIDWEYGDVTIPKGKGNKYRVVSLSDISLTAIRMYLSSGIRPSYLSDDDYLFGTTAEHKFGGNRTGENWHRGTSQWLSKLVEKHVKDVTGKEGFRSHSLRHNGARLDLNNGATLERIQAELGHSSVQTTEIYAGRLQPKRHIASAREVYAERDRCAQENLDRISRLA